MRPTREDISISEITLPESREHALCLTKIACTILVNSYYHVPLRKQYRNTCLLTYCDTTRDYRDTLITYKPVKFTHTLTHVLTITIGSSTRKYHRAFLGVNIARGPVP